MYPPPQPSKTARLRPAAAAPPPVYGGPPPSGPYGPPRPPRQRGLPGWGWGIVLGCGIPAALAFFFVIAAFLTGFNRGFARSLARVRQRVCYAHLARIGMASAQYAEDNDQTLPPGDRWTEAITPYLATAKGSAVIGRHSAVPAERTLRCPAAPSTVGGGRQSYGYALNSGVAAQRLSAIPDAAATITYYDSTTLARDASDPVTSLPRFGRHQEGNDIAYADGHVAWKRAGVADSPDRRPPGMDSRVMNDTFTGVRREGE